MTQEEILEYNKRCAEFLGWKYHPETANHGRLDNSWEYKPHYYYFDLKFHSDWNWIMEVVEAIESQKFNFRITRTCVTVETSFENNSYFKPIHKFHTIDGEFKTKKEAVVQAINQFLIWYENNK